MRTSHTALARSSPRSTASASGASSHCPAATTTCRSGRPRRMPMGRGPRFTRWPATRGEGREDPMESVSAAGRRRGGGARRDQERVVGRPEVRSGCRVVITFSPNYKAFAMSTPRSGLARGRQLRQRPQHDPPTGPPAAAPRVHPPEPDEAAEEAVRPTAAGTGTRSSGSSAESSGTAAWRRGTRRRPEVRRGLSGSRPSSPTV
jgi:hypothetical protein